MNDNFLNRLGMARKANLLIIGSEAVFTAIKTSKTRLVIIAADISSKTEKELLFLAKTKIPVKRVKFTKNDISAATGAIAGIVAIKDRGYAAATLECIDRNDVLYRNSVTESEE